MDLAYHSLQHSPMFGETSSRLPDVVVAAATSGFQVLGLDLASVEPHGPGGARRLLDDAGLRCGDLVGFVPDPRVPSGPQAARIAQAAVELGAPVVVGYVPAASAMSWALLVDRIGEAAATFATAGVRLGLEFIPHSAVTRLEAAVALCEEIGWESTGIVLDSVHLHLSGGSLADVERLRPEQLALVQLADVASLRVPDLAEESRQRRLMPGDGVLPLAEWVSFLGRSGYAGTVATEVLSATVRAADPVRGARATMAALVRVGLVRVGLG